MGERFQELQAAISVGKIVTDALRRIAPTLKQAEILRAAAQAGGALYVIDQSQQRTYPIVRAGQLTLGDDDDALSQAEYWEALVDLAKLGFVEHDDGIVYRLTAAGLRKAASLGPA